MTNKTKHREVLEFIQASILSGEYQAGDRLPSDGQLMRMFSTSRPTVSKAMRELENEGFLTRVKGSGSFVSMPNQSKPSLIGVIVPELGEHELFEPICAEIATQCRKHNLSLLWEDSPGGATVGTDHEWVANKLCQRYLGLGVAGVFFAPVEFSVAMLEVNQSIAERLDNAGISVVLLDRDLERLPKRSRFDLIGIDNFRVGMLQTEHLIEMGAKKLLYFSRDAFAPTIDIRIAGFRHAIHSNQMGKQTNSVCCGDPNDKAFVAKVLSRKPDGIVCANDTTADMLMRTIQDIGLKVPDDVKLIGVDNVKVASQASVPLTTIRQRCQEMGSAAVAAMVRRIENRRMAPRDIHVGVDLVVRSSCGATQNKQSKS